MTALKKTALKKEDTIPIGEARQIVKDLFTPNPSIYWMDFLIHVTLGWGAFVLALGQPDFSGWQAIFFVVSGLALYRAVIFTHELTHLKKNTFKFFRLVWNVTCGFPLMVPSFTYHGVHNDHHKRDIYGTTDDGEYLPFGAQKPHNIILYVLLSVLLPLMFAVRFIVLTPLAYLNNKIRNFSWARASSLSIDLSYRRPPFSTRDDATWRLQEFMTFVYGSVAVALMTMGMLSYRALVLWYLVTLMIFLLNSLRTLAAHSYRNSGESVMSTSEQYLDSVNVPGNIFFTALWAPVGLRYHATHHLFPAMPYHALGQAHRRLAIRLPTNELYLQTTRNSLWDALRQLWKDAESAQPVS